VRSVFLSDENFLEKPLLIVGTRRSGSTLLSRILNVHSKISLPFEQQTCLLRYADIRFKPLTDKQNTIRLIDKIRNERLMLGISFPEQEKNKIIQYLDEIGYSLKNLHVAFALFHFKINKNQRWGEKYSADCRDVDLFLLSFLKDK